MTTGLTRNTALLAEQHRGTQFAELMHEWLDLMETHLAAPLDVFGLDIDTSEGAFLDEIGARLGLPRPRIEDDEIVFLGFSDEDTNFDGRGVLATSDPVRFPGVPVADETYRCFLKARAIALRSVGSRRDFVAGLRCLSPGGEPLVQTRRPPVLREETAALSTLAALKKVIFADGSVALLGFRSGGANAVRIAEHSGDVSTLSWGLPAATQFESLAVRNATLYDRSPDTIQGDSRTYWRGRRYSALTTALDAAPTIEQSSQIIQRVGFVASAIYYGDSVMLVGSGDVRYSMLSARKIYRGQLRPGRFHTTTTRLDLIQSQGRLNPTTLEGTDNPTPYPVDITETSNFAEMTHDYRYAHGEAGQDSVVYIAANHRIYQTTITDWQESYHNSAPASLQLTPITVHFDMAQKLGVTNPASTDGVVALAYHDSQGEPELYGVYRDGSGANTRYRLFIVPAHGDFAFTEATLQVDLTIYHPNLQFRAAVARNIDALVMRPVGVRLNLMTQEAP